MRTSRKKTKKTTIVVLISAIVAVQLAIFFVWRSGNDDDEATSKNTEIAAADTKEAPLAAANPVEELGTQPSELPTDVAEPGIPDEVEDPTETPTENSTDDAEVIENGGMGNEETAETEDVVEEVPVAPTPALTSKNRDQPNETRRQKIARERKVAKEIRAQEKLERKRAAAEAEAAARAATVAPIVPEKGKFSVSTNPSGATVALDGVFIGKSPLRNVEVSPGRHSIALSLTGYEPKVVAVRVSLGSTKTVSESMTKEMVAVVAPKESPKAPILTVADRLPRTPRVSGSGSASAGQGILGSKCNGCHRKSGTSSVGPRSRTSKQWERFFSRGSHDRYRRIGGDMSSGQIANVKAYLISKAADTARNQGAGIR